MRNNIKSDDGVRTAFIAMKLLLVFITLGIGISTGAYALYLYAMLLFFDTPLPPNIIMAPTYMVLFLFLAHITYKDSSK